MIDCEKHASQTPHEYSKPRRQTLRDYFVWAACIFLLLFYFRQALLGTKAILEQEPEELSAKEHRFESLFLTKWADHVISHPIKAQDRTAFAEMGLRTQMYAHLLHDTNMPRFDYFESVLWPFIPGIKQVRQSYLSGTRSLPGKGRGIVASLGKGGFRFAAQFVTLVRQVHGSNLPIELYYYGEDDLPLVYRKYLTSMRGVTTHDIEAMRLFDPQLVQLKNQGFALKPFALIATNLTEVILADVDAIFLSSPDAFFDVEGYKGTGTLFFHDRDHVREGASTIVHDFLNDQLEQRGPSEYLSTSSFWTRKGIYQQESGIVVVDKGRVEVFAALLFAAWQNTGLIRDQTTYRVFWGDKETFWLAFELAQFPYYFVEHYAGALGRESSDGEFCSDHPLHFFDSPVKDPSTNATQIGKPAWFNGSLLNSKNQDGELFLEASSWAMDGQWEFLEDIQTWCLRNYTKSDMRSHPFSDVLTLLSNAGQRADLKAKQYLETQLPI